MNNLTVKRREIAWLALGCILVMSAYLIPGALSGNSGFPLDDAWIHQTYARNLATFHQWAYFPGNTTNGSTAPLWTFILSVGYFFNLPYLQWAYFCGGVFLFGTGFTARVLLNELSPRLNWLTFAGALMLTGEWHLVWASASGMETIFYAFCVVVLFLMTVLKKKNWLVMGLLVGLMIWIRPDAVTLAGPLALILVLSKESQKEKALHSAYFLTGVLIFFIAYLLFNKSFSGSWMPNTFYAKQAEYAAMLDENWFLRFGLVAFQPIIGGGALLLPGLVYILIKSYRLRAWTGLIWFTWWLGYGILYASLLPVAYQHGRYQMPAMPVFWILGLWGTIEIISMYWRKKKWAVPVKAWGISILAIWAAFLILGARAYTVDTSIIQTEMVTTAKWIATSTPPDAVIAAHDIGALGYFGKHKLIDLAGLVTPDVIAIIRNEKELANYLDTHGADYLMTFPGWYQDLPSGKAVTFEPGEQPDSDPMMVYVWKSRK